MANSVGFTEKWNAFVDKVRPGTQAVGGVLGKIYSVFHFIFLWIYRLRGLFMAIPVLYAAIKLAMYNGDNLPERVGLNLLSTGEFAQLVDRSAAVYGPLGVTAACLLLMLFSRRSLYPWIISIFTLVLPLLILMTNNLDAFLALLAVLKFW